MNKLAVDTYYSSGKAYTVGVVFSSWSQKYPDQIISTESEIEEDYIPGEFYKRELPCIMNLISEAINLQYFDTIIVDGFVMLPGDKKGLGAKLWDLVKDKFPHLSIIGVAKSPFDGCQSCSIPVLRGKATNPLWVNSIGNLDSSDSAGLIHDMAGKYRIPDLLKILDKETKKSRN